MLFVANVKILIILFQINMSLSVSNPLSLSIIFSAHLHNIISMQMFFNYITKSIQPLLNNIIPCLYFSSYSLPQFLHKSCYYTLPPLSLIYQACYYISITYFIKQVYCYYTAYKP